MQTWTRRREPGERLAPRESRKAIIRFLFEQEEGEASEPDIREALRVRHNIIEIKGIRERLRILERDGLIEKRPGRGLSNVWSLRPTQQLLEWCRDELAPLDFIKVYRSPVGSQIVAGLPGVIGMNPGRAVTDEVRVKVEEMDAWANRAMLVSPSIWEYWSGRKSIAVIAMSMAFAEFSASAERADDPVRPVSLTEAHYFHQIRWVERMGSAYLACLAVDAVQYAPYIAREILALLEEDIVREFFSPMLIDHALRMVITAMRQTALLQEIFPQYPGLTLCYTPKEEIWPVPGGTTSPDPL